MPFKIFYEKIESCAIKLEDGRIFTGSDHESAAAEAHTAGVQWTDIEKCICGFMIDGEFFNREQAFNIAISNGILCLKQPCTPGRLDSYDLPHLHP
jgi:hypothetical protein